jgi:hypothetical protein
MRAFGSVLFAAAAALLLPAVAYGQGSISGIVRDTSGAILPGVTVEAASPALIEKVRVATTDASGRYQVVSLTPGTYSVTFSLPGFNTVRREGIEISGTFAASVDIDMRVGTVEETITVTGESPIVDVQNTTQQRVIDSETIAQIPTGRNVAQLGVMIPGVTVTGVSDVGGSGGQGVGAQPGIPALMVHGSANNQQVMMQNGVIATDIASTGYISPLLMNPTGAAEVVIDTSAASAEHNAGGVRINVITRDGGNTFNGSMFMGFTTSALQADNFDDRLRDLGITTSDSVKSIYDVNPGFGGPIKRDRLWFYASLRWNGNENYAAGSFYNKNANNPSAWTFDPDLSRPLTNNYDNRDGQVRFTFQANQRNKIGFVFHDQGSCFCQGTISPVTSLEASIRKTYPVQRSLQADWTAPITTRLLLEAGGNSYFARTHWGRWPGLDSNMIAVQEQSSGLWYRSGGGGTLQQYRSTPNHGIHWRGALSYITGTHNLKVGFNHSSGWQKQRTESDQPVWYRFNNGVPNQITMLAWPYPLDAEINHNLGMYAQDRWTLGELTLSYGLRYDYISAGWPEHHLGPTFFTPNRDITIPAAAHLHWHDVSPRIGAAYDLFGTGRTALTVSLNKYKENVATAQTLVAGPNPANNVINTTTRSWADGNRDYVPDCNLFNPAANGECGAMANPNLGQLGSGSVYDPDILDGWGKRATNWEFAASVRHELVTGMSVDVGYFRRWFYGFLVTDNRTVSPADFDRFSIAAPADPRLPDGGGQVVPDLFNLNPAKFGLAADNYVTLADNYGDQSEYWHGVDVNVNARLDNGLVLRGGVSTGRRVTDNCEIIAALPETSPLGMPYCHRADAWSGSTQVKMIASYTIPRIDLFVSGLLQSVAGPLVTANYTATNAVIAPSLGRNLSGGAANVVVNIVEPGIMYGDRMNQLDLRMGRAIPVGRGKTMLNFDIYNVLNANAVLTENPAYGRFRQPTNVLQGRLGKISLQFDF